MTPLLEARGLARRFGPVAALDQVDLVVGPGRVHAVLGENGAGKSTLMNVLYGLLRPDAGTLRFRGRPVRLDSPADALALGIGMVHQHFRLVDRLSVLENVWLAHPDRPRFGLARAAARRAVEGLAGRFRLRLDPDAAVGDLSVAERQQVEIAKALSRPCSLLILDEPTAVLAPPEIDGLFDVLRGLADAGTSILFITHKLDEVLRACVDVTVLRRGRVTLDGPVRGRTRDELARAILGGGDAPRAAAPAPARRSPGEPRLVVRGIRRAAGRRPLRDVSFELRSGSILGVAGVDGNGQEELAAVLAGLAAPDAGEITLGGRDVTRLDVRARWRLGLAVVPGDRGRDGLLAEAPVWENLAMRDFGAPWARTAAGWVDPSRHRARAAALLERHDVRAAGPDAPAGTLSGGNQQKLLVARELAEDPDVVVLLNPTRGLDLGAASALLETLGGLAARGAAVMLISTELEEVAAASDRWAVLRDGRLVESPGGDPERLGALMLGVDA